MIFNSNNNQKIESRLLGESGAGFTIIELLVVVTIIGILSSIVLVNVTGYLAKAKITAAKAQLYELRKAIAIMAADTGVWPNGCKIQGTVTSGNGNEVDLQAAAAGLASAPSVGPVDLPDCEWTSSEVASWLGPYVKFVPVDPWGTAYWFDSDYEAYKDCPSVNPKPGTSAVIVSAGPDGIGPPFTGPYGCDDVFIPIY